MDTLKITQKKLRELHGPRGCRWLLWLWKTSWRLQMRDSWETLEDTKTWVDRLILRKDNLISRTYLCLQTEKNSVRRSWVLSVDYSLQYFVIRISSRLNTSHHHHLHIKSILYSYSINIYMTKFGVKKMKKRKTSKETTWKSNINPNNRDGFRCELSDRMRVCNGRNWTGNGHTGKRTRRQREKN